MKFMLRPACEEDKPFLQWLEKVCMRDYAVALWGAWRPNSEEKIVLRDHRIVVNKGEDVGCVATIHSADDIWINRLYIAPSHQRHGLGAAVLRMVIAQATALGLPVKVSVLTTNPAIAFYIREGLQVYEERSEHIFLTT